MDVAAISSRLPISSRPLGLLILSFAVMFAVFLNTPVKTPILETPRYNSKNLSKTQSKQTESVTFKDVTLLTALSKPHISRGEHLDGIHHSLGAGSCALDYNNDGWMDLLVLNGSGTDHFYGHRQWWQSNTTSVSLYENNLGQDFDDVTSASGLLTQANVMGCNTADLDNDGDVDLIITAMGLNQVWRNNNDGTFTDITQTSGFNGEFWSTSVSFSDVNADGLIDVFISNYINYASNTSVFESDSGYQTDNSKNFAPSLYPGQPNQLYVNKGNLQFTDKTNEYGLTNSQGRTLASKFVDLNGDTLPDLITVNDQASENKAYVNISGNKFEEQQLDLNLSISESTHDVGILVDDKNSPKQIIYSTNNESRLKVYARSNASNDKKFADIAESTGLHKIPIGMNHWGITVADFNLDGFSDIFIANGLLTPNSDTPLIPQGQPNTLLLNVGDESFTDSSQQLSRQTSPLQSSRCASSIDYNNDGLLDLLITQNNGMPQLLENTSVTGDWIGLSIISDDTPKSIELKTEKNVYRKFINDQSSFLCSGDNRTVFGLVDEQPLEIIINWNNGKTDTITDLEINRYNSVQSIGDSLILSQAPRFLAPKSNIQTASTSHKIMVIRWLIQLQKFEAAYDELKLLINTSDKNQAIKVLELSQSLPAIQHLVLVQQALTHKDRDVVLAGVSYAKTTEHESLLRWLLPLLKSKDSTIACTSTNLFESFFDEEEAMPIHKYLALDNLIFSSINGETPTKICAINALGHSENYRAISPLTSLLKHRVSNVRSHAALNLGLVKEISALDALNVIVLDADELSQVRAKALMSVKKISPANPIEPELIKLLQHTFSDSELENVVTTILFTLQNKDTSTLLDTEYLFNEIQQIITSNQAVITDNTWLANIELKAAIAPDTINQEDVRKLLLSPTGPDQFSTYKALVEVLPQNESNTLLITAIDNNVISDNNINSVRFKFIPAGLLNSQHPLTANRISVLAKLASRLEFSQQLVLLDEINSSSILSIEKKSTLTTKVLENITMVSEAECNQLYSKNSEFNQIFLDKHQGCLPQKIIAKAPTISIKEALASTNEIEFHSAISVIANRPERWAKDSLKSIIESDDINENSKIFLVNQLKKPLPKSVQKTLTNQVNKHPTTALTAAIITKLPNEYFESHKELLAVHLAEFIATKRDKLAINYGELFFESGNTAFINLFYPNEKNPEILFEQ